MKMKLYFGIGVIGFISRTGTRKAIWRLENAVLFTLQSILSFNIFAYILSVTLVNML